MSSYCPELDATARGGTGATSRPPRRAGTFAAVTLKSNGICHFLFLFTGAAVHRVARDTVTRDHDGFILTGAAANMDNLLETDVRGVFAAGDVRSGSTKRCATAVGEGAMAVQFVHAHLSRTSAVEEVT